MHIVHRQTQTPAVRRRVLSAWGLLGAWLILALPAAAAAQTINQAEAVTVALWPEYDRPEVLVIYRVVLPPSAQLPASVAIPIPADAPELTAVAYRDTNGGLLNAVHNRIEGQTADVVQVEAPGREVQLEFYLPLQIEGSLRRFEFTWPGGLSTSSFQFEVQQPVGAVGMEISPSPTSQTTDSVGLTYHRVDLGPQSDQAQPKVEFNYRKDTASLSKDITGGAGALATPAPAPSTSVDVKAVAPWLVLLAGVALIAGGVAYYLRTRAEERPARPRHRPAAGPTEEPDEVDASPVFCHNCGTQASASDRFCRRCGTALRT